MTRNDFNDLVRQLNRNLYGYAFRILRNQEESEDAVQEVFIKLWGMGKKLDAYVSIPALATTMIKNLCIDKTRKQKHFLRGDYQEKDFYNMDNSSPLTIMEDSETGDILSQIIDHLPDSYKLVINMREVEGLSYDEIAYKTEQNINTLRVTLSRARKIIREEYNKYHHERRGFKEVDR